MPVRSPVSLLCCNLAPTIPSASLPHPRCAISTLPLCRAMPAASATIAGRVSQSIHGLNVTHVAPVLVGTHRSASGPTPTSQPRMMGLRRNSPARDRELALCRSPAVGYSVQFAAMVPVVHVDSLRRARIGRASGKRPLALDVSCLLAVYRRPRDRGLCTGRDVSEMSGQMSLVPMGRTVLKDEV